MTPFKPTNIHMAHVRCYLAHRNLPGLVRQYIEGRITRDTYVAVRRMFKEWLG